MKRAALLLFIGLAISFGAHYLAYKLISFKYYLHEGDMLMVISYFEVFGVFPAVSVFIGVIIGLLESRTYWWLPGASLIPFFGYILFYYLGWDGYGLMLFLIYTLLCTGSAYLITRWKHGREAQV
jgi:hypothetical protein